MIRLSIVISPVDLFAQRKRRDTTCEASQVVPVLANTERHDRARVVSSAHSRTYNNIHSRDRKCCKLCSCTSAPLILSLAPALSIQWRRVNVAMKFRLPPHAVAIVISPESRSM